jgi:hypothetical protein
METPMWIGHYKFYHGRQQSFGIAAIFSAQSKGMGVMKGQVFLCLITMQSQFLSQLIIGVQGVDEQ